MKSEETGALIIGALLGAALAIGAWVGMAASPRIEVDYYLDKENNVICYTTAAGGISCLPYNDEGTHLEVLDNS